MQRLISADNLQLILWETGPGPGETGTENDYESEF